MGQGRAGGHLVCAPVAPAPGAFLCLRPHAELPSPPAAAGGRGWEARRCICDGGHVDHRVQGLGCAATPTPHPCGATSSSLCSLPGGGHRTGPLTTACARPSRRPPGETPVGAGDHRGCAGLQELPAGEWNFRLGRWPRPAAPQALALSCPARAAPRPPRISQGTVSDMTLDVSTGIAYVMHNCEAWGGDPKRCASRLESRGRFPRGRSRRADAQLLFSAPLFPWMCFSRLTAPSPGQLAPPPG